MLGCQRRSVEQPHSPVNLERRIDRAARLEEQGDDIVGKTVHQVGTVVLHHRNRYTLRIQDSGQALKFSEFDRGY